MPLTIRLFWWTEWKKRWQLRISEWEILSLSARAGRRRWTPSIVYGEASVDESSLTGESIPVLKSIGDSIISGSIVTGGILHVRAEKVGEDTTLSQIVRLVSDAGATKAPVARLADKISGIFVPIVIGISLVTLAVWLIFGDGVEHCRPMRRIGARHILSVRAWTCDTRCYHRRNRQRRFPRCAHQNGRGTGDAWDAQNTSCLTKPEPSPTGNHPSPTLWQSKPIRRRFFSVAAALEKSSEHPLSSAVVAKAEELSVTQATVDSFSSIAGKGISAW